MQAGGLNLPPGCMRVLLAPLPIALGAKERDEIKAEISTSRRSLYRLQKEKYCDPKDS